MSQMCYAWNHKGPLEPQTVINFADDILSCEPSIPVIINEDNSVISARSRQPVCKIHVCFTAGSIKCCEPARGRCSHRCTLWNIRRRKLPTILRSPCRSMKSTSISRELLPASPGHPGLFLLPGWTLMHTDVPPPQLGQLGLPVGVSIQYLSLKGFFHSCSQKVS